MTLVPIAMMTSKKSERHRSRKDRRSVPPMAVGPARNISRLAHGLCFFPRGFVDDGASTPQALAMRNEAYLRARFLHAVVGLAACSGIEACRYEVRIGPIDRRVRGTFLAGVEADVRSDSESSLHASILSPR